MPIGALIDLLALRSLLRRKAEFWDLGTRILEPDEFKVSSGDNIDSTFLSLPFTKFLAGIRSNPW